MFRQGHCETFRVGNFMPDMTRSGMMRMPPSSWPHPDSSQGDASVSSPAKLTVVPDAQAEPDDLVCTPLEEGQGLRGVI